MSQLETRKAQHVKIVAENAAMDRQRNYFDDIRLMHRALPEINLDEIDPSVEFLGKKLTFPFMISAMTGGASPLLQKINTHLAEAAEAEGIAMGVGSQRILFAEPAAESSFALRGVAPNTPLLANLGAVQFNENMTLQHANAAVDVLQADALCLHLNPLQEAIQPEGDTHFSNLRKKIGEIVQGLEVPVIAKAVGAGISAPDAALLIQAGIHTIDVAGSGGTSWSWVEGERSDDPSLGTLFQDWGIPTPLALQQLAPFDLTLIASGGIRSGIDMAKAMILGASICAMARPFLAPAMESTDAVRTVIRRIKREFTVAIFLLGCKNIQALKSNGDLIL